jgi:hypothetical protein
MLLSGLPKVVLLRTREVSLSLTSSELEICFHSGKKDKDRCAKIRDPASDELEQPEALKRMNPRRSVERKRFAYD